jgi:hypothetical protein
MRILLRRAMRSDPTTFVVAFGVFATICGITLLLPGNAFDFTPAWSSLQALHADDTMWGVVMFLDGLLLIISIRMAKVPQRAAIAAFSAVMWGLLGASMVISAYQRGITSIIGWYAIFGAIWCLVAVGQWVHYPSDGGRRYGDR